MKLSNGFYVTKKEIPTKEDCISNQLLIRSGMISKNSSGIYTYLPLGFRVLKNLEKVITEELNKNNAYQLLMPSMVENEIFESTSRDKLFESELFKAVGNDKKEYSLCPTHEELFTIISKLKIRSYKDLHFYLYQISNKYRNEQKVRYGLIRKKEFMMCDVYSFDTNAELLDISYDKMYNTFSKIFKRLGLDFITVDGNAEQMKGSLCEEFQALSPLGDDEIVKCTRCSYSSNANIAKVEYIKKSSNEEYKDIKIVSTKDIKKTKDLASYFEIEEEKIIKSICYKVNDEYVMAILCAVDEVNEEKLKKILNTRELVMASEEEIENMGSCVGFIGPIKATMKVIADPDIKNIVNGVCGSNVKDYHYINVNQKRDFKVDLFADIKKVSERHLCPKCGSKTEMLKGIEIGNIFKLDTGYSKKFNLAYLDERNSFNYVYMGSYGIGLDRCIASIVEQNHDDDGIIWPLLIAPFKVGIIVINMNDSNAKDYAITLYEKLTDLGIDTVLDDRKESAGVKFKEMDLIGVPIRITIGNNIIDNNVEFKLRSEKESKVISTVDLINEIKKEVNYYK